jgi:hypothetical protein
MRLDQWGRNWIGPFPFSIQSIDQQAVKNQPGVYQVLYQRLPVYIGVSSDCLFGRLRAHAKGLGNRGIAGRLQRDAFEFEYWLCDGVTARQIESHTLIHRRPELNAKIEYINYIASIAIH